MNPNLPFLGWATHFKREKREIEEREREEEEEKEEEIGILNFKRYIIRISQFIGINYVNFFKFWFLEICIIKDLMCISFDVVRIDDDL